MSFLKDIRNKVTLFGFIMCSLVLSCAITNATEAHCKHQKLDQLDNFCEQTARHEYLEKTWGILNFALDKEQIKLQYKPTKSTIIKELFENKTTEMLDGNLPIKWPRPKIITRHFETAVASLDIDGKKDLKSCTMHGLIDNKEVLNTPEHQLKAIIYFSNASFRDLQTSNITLNSSLSLRSCTQLINLVLGKT